MRELLRRLFNLQTLFMADFAIVILYGGPLATIPTGILSRMGKYSRQDKRNFWDDSSDRIFVALLTQW